MLTGFLYTLLVALGFIIVIGLLKLFQYTRSRGEEVENGEKKEKRGWRPEVASMGSAIGLAATYFIIAITLSFFLNKNVGQALVKNPIFWSLPIILLLFYWAFRMGIEIPVWLFKGINTVVIIAYIILIFFTTAKAVNPEFLKPKPTTEQRKKADKNQQSLSGRDIYQPPPPKWQYLESADIETVTEKVDNKTFLVTIPKSKRVETGIFVESNTRWLAIRKLGGLYYKDNYGKPEPIPETTLDWTSHSGGQLIFTGGKENTTIKIVMMS